MISREQIAYSSGLKAYRLRFQRLGGSAFCTTISRVRLGVLTMIGFFNHMYWSKLVFFMTLSSFRFP